MCAANEERGRKNVRGAGRLAMVTLEDQLLVMTRLRIRLGWLQQELAYIFWCVGGLCVTHLSRSGLVSRTWGWDDFRRCHLGRMWRYPWQSASVQTTLTHLLSWLPQELCTEIRSCLALQSQLYSSYKSRTTLKDLIGISLNGSIYFVSELWSGPISDRELVIKSVMFCLSKTFFIITFTSGVTFQLFFSFWLPSSVACWLAWLLHKHHVLSLKKKKSNNRIHKHCSLSIPPFFSNFFRVCWFGWLIHEHHVSLKNFFHHIHKHCCYLSLFCFSDTFDLLVNGSWSHDKLSAPYFVPCCTENISIIEIDHNLHCYHWMLFTKRLWEKVPTTTRHN